MLKISETKEEKGLYDLWKILQKYYFIILISTLIFSIAGFILSATRERIWEGSMVMRIGQIGEDNPIEPLVPLLAKSQHPTFLTSIVNLLNLPPEEKAKTFDLLKESIRLNMMDYYNHIEFKLRAHSPEQAKLLLETIAQQISKHNQLIPEQIEQMKKKTVITKANLSLIDKRMSNIEDKLPKECINTPGFKDSIKAIRMRTQEEITLEKRLEKNELMVAQTYPTQIINDIYVSKEPTSPSKLLFTLLYAFLGLISSVVFTLVYNELKNERKH